MENMRHSVFDFRKMTFYFTYTPTSELYMTYKIFKYLIYIDIIYLEQLVLLILHELTRHQYILRVQD
jgi:hypothetical protein